MYNPRFGRWMSVDPQAQYANPYEAMGNNPVSKTDAKGDSASTTIVDQNNRILDVILDGKTDIIKLNGVNYDDVKDFIKSGGTSLIDEFAAESGIKLSDHTFWDSDFMTTDGKNHYYGPAYGENIYTSIPNFSGTGGDYISKVHDDWDDYARHFPQIVDLADLAFLSRNTGPYDLKVSLGLDAYAGIRFNDNTVTSLRVASNILFGQNLYSCKDAANDAFDFYNAAMFFVGKYNQIENGPGNYNSGYPFFGEETISGKGIYLGYWGTKL
jgi:hypothetical protein